MIAEPIHASLAAAFSGTARVSVAISGSVARGTPRLNWASESLSDLDVIVFVEGEAAIESLRLPKKIACIVPGIERIKLEGSFILTTKSRALHGPIPDSFIDACKRDFVRDDLDLRDAIFRALSRRTTEETVRYRSQPVAYYWTKWLATGEATYRERALTRLRQMQTEAGLSTSDSVDGLGGRGLDQEAAEDTSVVVTTLSRYFDHLGVQPLGSTAALLQYDECKSNPNELFRRVQRNSFMENHGLEPHEAVSEFCCELIPLEEGLANEED